MNKNPGDLDLFAGAEDAIHWWPPSGTFYSFESKKPHYWFRVECVTGSGHPANPIETTVNGTTYPAGQFYRARAHEGDKLVLSPLYDSVDEAKAACEHHRRHGTFPTPQRNPAPS